jgi:hypothetical protein
MQRSDEDLSKQQRGPPRGARPWCARARGKIRLVKLVTDAALTDWRSAAWLLERRWPNEYGRVERALDSQSQEVQTSVQFILNHGGKQQPITMEQAMHLFLPPCQVKTVVPAPSAESGDKDTVDDSTGSLPL